ncbi:MAG: endonuclease/exonuclease/phosphatase family protein [Verrucomicrobiales bacterium]
MPFLRRLIVRGDYCLRDFYSGLPSSTPAVQGEILFGIRTAVPSFSFYDRDAGVERRMFNPESARLVASDLIERSPGPLLTGGSSYSNIYAAGADCARFCAERLDLPSFFHGVSLAKVAVLLVLYFTRFVRIAALGVVETVLALIDCARGVVARQDILKELKFVPTRLGISIILRELIEFMIRLDIQEGVPVIHANLLGYDEQSHRRGPESRFAHWTLRGIDRVIRNVSSAAARAEGRDYEIVIYSDHGQESTVTYQTVSGQSIRETVDSVLGPLAPAVQASNVTSSDWLHLRTRSLFRRKGTEAEPEVEKGEVFVTAMGPIGQIYAPGLHKDAQLRKEAAHSLAASHKVPIVLYRDASDLVVVETAAGSFPLANSGARLVGDQHPFGQEVLADLEVLCRHKDAGDLVILGWRTDGAPITFAEENGSHGSIGANETRGFALAPRGFFPEQPSASPVRGEDIYRRSREYLGRTPAGGERAKMITPSPEAMPSKPLRVMTYNIHSCIGMDGRLRPERIARVIKTAHADIVALQEVDVRRSRTELEHQAETIGAYLGYHSWFYSLLDHHDDEEYGLAILSKFPFQIMKQGTLTASHSKRKREARGAIWALITLPDKRRLHLVNTHFGLSRKERLEQAATLLSDQWLQDIDGDESLIVCGDFNSTPSGKSYRLLTQNLRDAQAAAPEPTNLNTFSSTLPVARIDHIFVNANVEITGIDRPRTAQAALASDHLPLCADFRLVHSRTETTQNISHAAPPPRPRDAVISSSN